MPARNVSGVSLRQFFTAVLQQMGVPVTENNLSKLGAVAALEGHGGDYNPFNYVVGPGSNFNSVGVKNYADIQTGVNQLIKLLGQKNTSAMRANLAADGSYAGWLSATSNFYHSWGGPSLTINQQTALKKLDSQIDGPSVPQSQVSQMGQGGASSGSNPGQLSGSTGSGSSGVVAQAAANQPVQLPAGGTIYHTPTSMSVVYDLGNGVKIHFGIPWWDPSRVSTAGLPDAGAVSDAQWQQIIGANNVFGGDADGLKNIQTTYGSFQKFWDSILGQTIGYNNPASKDPGVLKVLAEFAARPDMSQAELQNKLKATAYWNTLTVAQQSWNDAPEAERTSQRNDMQARMIDTVFQYMGVRIGADDPLVSGQALEDVASGKIGFGAWTETIKQRAQSNPESPFSRTLRDEVTAERQHGIDIENTANQLRDTLHRWGLQWDGSTIAQWATNIVEKVWSDDDLMNTVKDQAQHLYPGKARDVETTTAAQPWIQAYGSLMEKEGDIFTPEVQQALQAGQTLFDFQAGIKGSSKWMATQNGQDAMYQTMDKLSQSFGFNK